MQSEGDSMLQTLHSDTKINILNPNLNVKIFSKGVQTYLKKETLVFPLYPIKRCFSELSRAWRLMSWGNCVSDVTFLNNHFLIVTFFKDIFLWIFNLEQKKFFNHQKKIPCNLVPVILQTKVCVADITQKCCGHYIFGNTFFVIHFLVSVAQCGYVNFFCSYSSKNEAVKLLFTLFNMSYYNII